MLPLGKIGIRAEQGDPRMTNLTKDEQKTLMSLFVICRSPLMFGGNLPDNDQFTLDLITNREVLAVHRRSRDNRLLVDDGERLAWIADDAESGDKYVAAFYVDRKPIAVEKAQWNSRLLTYRTGEQSDTVRVSVGGAHTLYLVVTPGEDNKEWDHADWIEPRLTGNGDTLHLAGTKWVSATSGWSTAKANQSVGGNALIVEDREYSEGIGTHATSIIEFDVPEGYDTFSSMVGLDKECVAHTEGATVRFHVFTQHPTGAPPEVAVTISLKPEQLGVKGSWTARDLWERKDLGPVGSGLSVRVRNHGASLLRIRERQWTHPCGNDDTTIRE
jgi:hypothetical protein